MIFTGQATTLAFDGGVMTIVPHLANQASSSGIVGSVGDLRERRIAFEIVEMVDPLASAQVVFSNVQPETSPDGLAWQTLATTPSPPYIGAANLVIGAGLDTSETRPLGKAVFRQRG